MRYHVHDKLYTCNKQNTTKLKTKTELICISRVTLDSANLVESLKDPNTIPCVDLNFDKINEEPLFDCTRRPLYARGLLSNAVIETLTQLNLNTDVQNL